MANTIKHKRGTTDPGVSDLVVGELAINTTDGGVFTKTDGGTVVEVGAGGATDIDGLSDGTTQWTENVGLGTNALPSLASGSQQNTALGRGAGQNITTSSNNTLIGAYTCQYNTGSNNTAVGKHAIKGVSGSSSGGSNTAVGTSAMYQLTTGTYNSAIGDTAARALTSGTYNVSIGNNSSYDLTTGSRNIHIGSVAGFSGANPSDQILLGHYSGYNSSGGGIIGLGQYALYSVAGSTTQYKIAIGPSAARSVTTGSNLIAIGGSAGYSVTSGVRNTFVGHFAGYTVSTGTENVAVGDYALQNGNASNCVAVGPYALQTSSGTGNTALGYYAGQTISTGTNNTCLGFGAAASSATVSNEITLGNSSITTLRCNTQTISSLSDGRDKTDVEDLPTGLSFIDSLRPVKFKWETRDGNGKDGTYEAGFIAQDLQAAQSEAAAEYLNMVMDENPDRLEARYGQLIPVLVQAIKELKSEVEQLKANAHES